MSENTCLEKQPLSQELLKTLHNERVIVTGVGEEDTGLLLWDGGEVRLVEELAAHLCLGIGAEGPVEPVIELHNAGLQSRGRGLAGDPGALAGKFGAVVSRRQYLAV